MARFWILLLIVWYKACSVAHTEDIQQSDNQITSQNTNPDQKVSEDKENVYYVENPMTYKTKTPMELMRHIMPMIPRELYELQRRNLANDLPNDLELNLIDDFTNEKRGFRSWGGKRDNFKDKKDEIAIPELAKTFYSWRGRRSMDPDYATKLYNLPELSEANYASKRDNRRFFFLDNWGGKRTYDDGDLSGNTVKEYVDFNSPLTDITTMGRRRHKFSSWGGKRSDDTLNEENIYSLKKNFHAWGGK